MSCGKSEERNGMVVQIWESLTFRFKFFEYKYVWGGNVAREEKMQP